MKQECLLCPETKKVIQCEVCKNFYCDLHFRWHIDVKGGCKKYYDKKKIKLEKDTNNE